MIVVWVGTQPAAALRRLRASTVEWGSILRLLRLLLRTASTVAQDSTRQSGAASLATALSARRVRTRRRRRLALRTASTAVLRCILEVSPRMKLAVLCKGEQYPVLHALEESTAATTWVQLGASNVPSPCTLRMSTEICSLWVQWHVRSACLDTASTTSVCRKALHAKVPGHPATAAAYGRT